MYFLIIRNSASTESGLKETNPAFFQTKTMLDFVKALANRDYLGN
jgi:hypothetical protein